MDQAREVLGDVTPTSLIETLNAQTNELDARLTELRERLAEQVAGIDAISEGTARLTARLNAVAAQITRAERVVPLSRCGVVERMDSAADMLDL